MKLLTKALEWRLPPIGSQEKLPLNDHVFYVRYFAPFSNWTWYACEFDPKERIFFGYVIGFEKEWGEFSLTEMEELGIQVERDLYFKTCTFKELPEGEK
jgi:hypothetical protein